MQRTVNVRLVCASAWGRFDRSGVVCVCHKPVVIAGVGARVSVVLQTQTLVDNVQRLKAYKSKLVVVPRKANSRTKKGDSAPEELKLAQQHTGALFPIVGKNTTTQFVKLTDDLTAKRVYASLRQVRGGRRAIASLAVPVGLGCPLP